LAATDDSEEVRQAVLEALERIQPALVKPVTTLLVDQNVNNCQAAAQQLALMGGLASPAIPVLIWHAKNAPTRFNAYPGAGMIAADIAALAKIGATDPIAVRTIIGHAVSPISKKDPPAFRGPFLARGPVYQERLAAVRALGELTHPENRGGLRKEIVACLLKVLVESEEEGLYHSSGLTIPAIQSLSQYGADAKEAIPLLKKLKLHDNMQVRESAAAALEKIEGQLR
jgi:HEAT repeat protein